MVSLSFIIAKKNPLRGAVPIIIKEDILCQRKIGVPSPILLNQGTVVIAILFESHERITKDFGSLGSFTYNTVLLSFIKAKEKPSLGFSLGLGFFEVLQSHINFGFEALHEPPDQPLLDGVHLALLFTGLVFIVLLLFSLSAKRRSAPYCVSTPNRPAAWLSLVHLHIT